MEILMKKINLFLNIELMKIENLLKIYPNPMISK